MSQTAVSLDALQAAHNKITSTHADVKVIQGQIHGHITNLLSDGWMGGGARSFGNVHAGFDAEFTKLLGALDQIAARVVQAKNILAGAMEQQRASVNQVSVNQVDVINH